MDKREVGERIRKFREARNMSQNALANEAGVSPTYIYQLERGEKSPTIEYLDHICWGLGIALEDFFNTNDDEVITDKINALSIEQRRLLNQFLNSL